MITEMRKQNLCIIHIKIMVKSSKEPEMNQENENLNEVNSIENEVVETITEEINEVTEPVVEVTENLVEGNVAETIVEEVKEAVETNSEISEIIISNEIKETVAEEINEVIEPIAEITQSMNGNGHTEAVQINQISIETELKEEPLVETFTDVIPETTPVVEEIIVEEVVAEKMEEPTIDIVSDEVFEDVKNEAEKVEELEPVNVSAIDIPELNEDITEIESLEMENEIEEVDTNYEHLNKEQLVLLLEEAIKTEDINSIKTKVALIKVSFLKIVKDDKQLLLEKCITGGGKKEEFTSEEDDFELRFRAAFDVYKEKKSIYNDEQEKNKLDNLKLKQEIIYQLKELVNSDETLKNTYDEFKSLQERWKEIGQVPRTEINTLWHNYHFLVELFFDKVKINKELKDLDMKKNMESKLELCEKAEELLLENNIHVSFKKLQNYHEEWKHIGPVPQDKRDELWERFKNISDQINDRRREFYDKIHEEYDGNLLAKTALVEKIEQLVSKENNSLNAWQNSSDEITEIIKIWKTVGPAPKKENDELWSRFKTYLDTFFANKKEYYDKLKDEQVNNLNIKVELCLQAESIKSRNDWRAATLELLDLQKKWKEVGPVSRKISDKIWMRFRAACDEFFNAKNDFFKNINENEGNNLKLKEELIQKVKDFKFGEDRNENLQALKDFQRQFTEIGFIPVSHKDRVYNEFRQAINACFETLKMNSAEVSALNMNSRIEKMSPAEANRFIGKERVFLSNKITKLKEDVSLWENNIGFLAHSKNADLLKQEFEKKINNAKQELIIMEAKLKSMPNH